MTRRIVAVGIEVAADEVDEVEFASKASLADWDIALFRPDIEVFTAAPKLEFQGRPSLTEKWSLQLKEASAHWRREINDALAGGKTIIVYLPAVEEVYVDTGEREYSGTGKGQRTTRIVGPHTNYSCIPMDLQPTNATGSSIRLLDSGRAQLGSYWAEFEEYSEYEATLPPNSPGSCLTTRNGERSVGAVVRFKDKGGTLVLLPMLDFYRDEFFNTSTDPIWTSKGKEFWARLVNAVVAIDKSLRGTSEATPEPSWAQSAQFQFTQERRLAGELLEAERRLEEATQAKQNVRDQLQEAGAPRALLFEKGKALEQAIIEALRTLGFEAAPLKEGGSEFDVVFESEEGRLLGEAEGKDSKPISVDKLRQLSMNILEDLDRDEVTKPAKGVLFGNGFRLTPPDHRAEQFTDKCIAAATLSSTALVCTSDLFRIVHKLGEQYDEDLAKACRVMLLQTVGIVAFPEVPGQDVEEPDQSAELVHSNESKA